jgi:MFS family permease
VTPRQPGLDWLNFFVAAALTGFGPFVPVYLTLQAWTLVQIGVVLSAQTVTSTICQVPGGALVDAVPQRRLVAAAAIAGLAASALVIAVLPLRLPVLLALLLLAFAGCVLSPAIAAISLMLAGQAGLGERLGRNARFAAMGSGLGAALMGAVGGWVSERSVFMLTAALALPALWALRAIRQAVPSAPPDAGCLPEHAETRSSPLDLLRDPRVLVFAACVLLYQLSSAAMLPVAANEVTRLVGKQANLLIAAFVVVPQIVVALASPAVGRASELLGRRVLLLLGWAQLPLRAALFAVISNPLALVPVQILDGVSGAVFGVMLPLVAADLTRGTGRYNLCLGLLGLAMTTGAGLSTTLAGAVASVWGKDAAFWLLGAIGLFAVLLLRAAMPETRVVASASAP